MTVWVVTNVRDKKNLEKWGEVRQINQRYCYLDEIEEGKLPDFFMGPLETAADNFNPVKDFLAITGDQAQCSQMIVLLTKRYNSFSIIRYDKIKCGYFKVVI